ncbi:helix-turn-helix transcriptional regulator [Novosphingobium sp. M1R2S20]|uniref:Helix-turn-helix transcriptional regulator n=1 Tax=Novosphingobium rhizovicinum TaxID=3228928 RepID=A0ABV3RF08_9SPHN
MNETSHARSENPLIAADQLGNDANTLPKVGTGDMATRAAIARETCPFLTAKQAAFHLGLAYSTLKRLRQLGTGPRCRRHGRTWRYHIDDVEVWSTARAKGGEHG